MRKSTDFQPIVNFFNNYQAKNNFRKLVEQK
jgi:hypothetical protein